MGFRLFVFSAVLVALAACSPIVVDPTGGGGGGGGGKFHPDGYAAAAVHGTDSNLQVLDCRGCHGADLAGGPEVTCDSCHAAGWRTDCSFCHGSAQTGGAPPRDLDDETTAISFTAHTRHALPDWTTTIDCAECHTRPVDVLSTGHMFDDTPAMAEVTFAGGLSAGASYSGGTCTNLYCHGNGRGPNGTVTDGDTVGCTSCHPGINSGNNAWSGMSGEHRRHLSQGIGCDECHASVAAGDNVSILDPKLHVDGGVTVVFTQGGFSMTANGRCNGSCHGQGHSNDNW